VTVLQNILENKFEDNDDYHVLISRIHYQNFSKLLEGCTPPIGVLPF